MALVTGVTRSGVPKGRLLRGRDVWDWALTPVSALAPGVEVMVHLWGKFVNVFMQVSA